MSLTIKVEELRGIAVLDCIEIAHGTDGLLGHSLDEIHLGVSFVVAPHEGDVDTDEHANVDLAVRRNRAESIATDLERMANRLRLTARKHVAEVVRMECKECQGAFAADDIENGTCPTCNSRYLEVV